MQLKNSFKIIVWDRKSNNAPIYPPPSPTRKTQEKEGLVHDKYKFSLE